MTLSRAVLLGGLLASAGISAQETQTFRFVQDDAQDRMVSKVYVLKYAQANDLVPFAAGIVKRYNINSAVNSISFGQANEQILTVTCPVRMMPYVDDFIRKADRPVQVAGRVPGDIIRGTGITRAVYRPKYRSGQTLVNLIVNAAPGGPPIPETGTHTGYWRHCPSSKSGWNSGHTRKPNRMPLPRLPH